MAHFQISNIQQIIRRARALEDPRWQFYQAVLGARTKEEYLAAVGDLYVVPPTHQRRMGAETEWRYMRDNRHWIAEFPSEAGEAAGFVPDPNRDARQRAMQSMVVRQGQSRFRAALIDAYGGSCAITGCQVLPLLEAAHITPYLGPHTNDISNGILLRADLHSLWDLGLLALDPTSRVVWVSPSVVRVDADYAALLGKRVREPRVAAARPSTAALEQQLQFALESLDKEEDS